MAKTYEDGVAEGILQGELKGHEARLDAHAIRHDKTDKRLSPLEKFMYVAIGGFVVVQILIPMLKYLGMEWTTPLSSS